MAKLTLYGTRLSPFVEKVARALELKRLEFTPVDLTSPGDLRRWNPVTGKMPVLEVDGEKVYDSTFILHRLDAIQPDPPLYAAGGELLARQRLLEDWADEALYWMLMALRWAPENAEATVRQIAPASVPGFLLPVLRRVLARQIGGMTKAQGMGRMPPDLVRADAARALDDLVALLAGRAFFHLDHPGAADLAVYGELALGATEATPDFQALLSERPALADFMKRVEEAAPSR